VPLLHQVRHVKGMGHTDWSGRVNTTVVIVDTVSRTILYLAFVGAGLKLLLAIAPRFQVAAPKAPVVRVNLQPETVEQDSDTETAGKPQGEAS
jgi:hypothetical protein